MRAKSARQIQNGNFDGFDARVARSVDFARDVHVGTADVRVDDQRQIGRVDMVLEIVAIHLDQVVITFLCQLI